MGHTVTISKFIGTISLGLLTGVSYSLSTATLPSLLALPTATTCSNTLIHLNRISRFHQRVLTHIPLIFYPVAYILSPSIARHPYLLWTTFAAATAGYGPEVLARFSGAKEEKPEAEAQGLLGEEEVNGESVRRDVESQRRTEVIRLGLSGFAFAMGVVGIWGDAY